MDKKIKSGATILNIEGWMKATGKNHISELSRKNQRYFLVDPNKLDAIPLQEEGHLEEPGLTEEDKIKIREALQDLKLEERQLLKWSCIEQLPYKKIAKRSSQASKQVSASTLRKRKQRLLQKLRDSQKLREVYFNKFSN